MKRLVVALLVTICAAYLLWYLRVDTPFADNTDGGATFSLSQLQFPALLVVLLALAQCSVGSVRLPRALLMAVVGCACMAFGWEYLSEGRLAKTFLLASFEGDEFETRTRFFRERLNDELSVVSQARVVSTAESVSTDAEARILLAQRPKLRGVLWSNGQWVYLSMPRVPARPLRGPQVDYLPLRHQHLLMIESVPILGVALEPQDQTRTFFGYLFAGMLPQVRREGGVTGDLGRRSLQENALHSAGTVQAFWTSYAHQAFAWFLLGNRAFEEAFEGPIYQKGYLRCAQRAYREAASRLGDGDNPELRAAILNNWGVSQLVQAVIERKSAPRKAGLKLLGNAYRTRTENNLYGVEYRNWVAARFNLLLVEASKKKSKGKQQRPKRQRKH